MVACDQGLLGVDAVKEIVCEIGRNYHRNLANMQDKVRPHNIPSTTLLTQLQDGYSALMVACRMGCLEAVQILLAVAGIEINLRNAVRYLHTYMPCN